MRTATWPSAASSDCRRVRHARQRGPRYANGDRPASASRSAPPRRGRDATAAAVSRRQLEPVGRDWGRRHPLQPRPAAGTITNPNRSRRTEAGRAAAGGAAAPGSARPTLRLPPRVPAMPWHARSGQRRATRARSSTGSITSPLTREREEGLQRSEAVRDAGGGRDQNNNLAFAKEFADKAERLAKELQGR